MDKNVFKSVEILISEQIALAAVFFFEQVFVFCMLTNKSALEWFLQVCREHTPEKIYKLFWKKPSDIAFLIKKRWPIDPQ